MTKAVVVDGGGVELSWGRSRTPWRPVPTGAEAAPADLLAAVLEATATALKAAPEGRVAGIGVTSMAETTVLVGNDGKPTGTCIAWHDTRGEQEAAQLAAQFGREGYALRTGLSPSYIRTLVKLAWLERRPHHSLHPHNGGAAPSKLKTVLSVADWVVHALGGEQVAEASLASRTGALSLAERSWWEDALAWAGVDARLFPPVVQAGQHVGRVSTRALGDLQLGGGSPLGRLAGAALAPAGHDHLCAAAGVGAIAADQVLDSCGTAEALVRTVPPLDEGRLRQAIASGLDAGWHTVPGRQALLSGRLFGMVLERVLRLLGIASPEALAALEATAEHAHPGSLRVVQEDPYGDPAVVGLDAEASPGALWAAALDAVAAGAAHAVPVMDAIAGPARELLLIGGWSHSPGLRERKLSLLPDVRWPSVGEAGGRGAALFGGVAAGLFTGPDDFPPVADRLMGTRPEGS